MSSLPGRGRDDGYSGAADRLSRIKRDLTLDLFMRRGPFWQEIRGLRDKWSIDVGAEVPQGAEIMLNPLYPPGWKPEPRGPKDGLTPAEKRDWQRWSNLHRDWYRDLDTLAYAVAPKPFDNLDYYLDTWRRFLGACVLSDPPETELLRFAAIGDLGPMKKDLRSLPPPYYPMVKQMRDWVLSASREFEEMWRVAERAVEKVAPTGVNPREVVQEAMRETYGSFGSQRSRQQELDERNPFRWYIEVDDHASEDDVRQAFSLLRAKQEGRPKPGRTSRDPLKSVQIALLYDKHNGPAGGNDGRRRKWTHANLGERFGLTPRGVEGHVKQGRELLQTRPQPED